MLRYLYWAEGFSIRETAKLAGISYSSAQRKLGRIGKVRSQSEGQTRHERRSFSGDGLEKAYLVGLRAGDLNAWRKTRNTIEARVSTTRPAMARLFIDSFKWYGHIMADAGRAYLPERYRWQMRVHLDNSFEFLIGKDGTIPRIRSRFYYFLGGYSDSECCWSIYLSKGRIKVSWTIESRDILLLHHLRDQLRSEGFHPVLYVFMKHVKHRFRKNQKSEAAERESGRLRLGRMQEVVLMATRLLQISRHREKISKMRLIVGIEKATADGTVSKLNKLRRKTRLEAKSFEAQAEREYKKGKAPTLVKGSSASLV